MDSTMFACYLGPWLWHRKECTKTIGQEERARFTDGISWENDPEITESISGPADERKETIGARGLRNRAGSASVGERAL
jgi:hypothetical protein